MKTTLLILLLPFTLLAQKHVHKEVYYQKEFSRILMIEGIDNNTEVRLSDNTRCDIVTGYFAIEVDFASKWAEGVGQSLHYALMLNKKPAILLILEDDKDIKYLNRIKVTANKYNITIWTIDKELKWQRIDSKT